MGHRPKIFLPSRVTILGVLNTTPDSFSDGGRFVEDAQGRLEPGTPGFEAACDAALAMEEAGADVIDIGGESTRPGAEPVDVDTEIARTVPVIRALRTRTGIPLSIDTRKAKVARAALEAGATIVNDVSGGLHDPDLLDVCAALQATLIVGHLRGTPATMQSDPHFDDVLLEVAEELERATQSAEKAGVARDNIIVDPGIGFGKRLEDNLQLMVRPGWLRERLGRPVLLGPSRKAFLGALTGDAVAERDVATTAACAVAVFCGADAIRVHDVAAGVRAAAVASALRSGNVETGS